MTAPRDHLTAELRAATALADTANDSDGRAEPEPADGYGPGFLVYQLASYFHALCCVIGPEAARQEMSEIMTSEAERKRQ